MARDEFFRDIRRAVSFMAPRVEADSPFTDTHYIERMLRGTDMWLAQGVVAAFRPDDFPDLDESARARLAGAVSDFLAVARTVPPKEPARQEQRDAALGPFMQIIQAVQSLVRDDWMRASSKLLGEAEEWAKEVGWPTKRYSKDITEDFIGTYKQDRLVFSAEGTQLVLVPVGRFAPGTDGMFDLAVMPAYDSVMVVRQGDRWFIHPLPWEEKRQDWSKDAFLGTSLKLSGFHEAGKKTDRCERMKSVEREYQVAEKARTALEEALTYHSGLLTASGLTAVDLRTYRSKLHDTYFIRLFAEFETGLKDYWKNGLREDPSTRIMDVISSIGAKLRILDAWRINAHAARKWRNRLIHEEDAEGDPVTLTEARRYLGRFFGSLPENW